MVSLNQKNPIMNPPSTSRRRFLGGILSAAVAPQIIPSRLLASETAPSNQIALGHIGVGGRGSDLLTNFLSVPGARSVAVADPYDQRRQRAGGLIQNRQNHEPKQYRDFRELLADESIDAVVVATPDHWHVPIGLEAVRSGKDLYLEKPLGYTMSQNKALEQAVQKHKAVFQYGTQQRGMEINHRAMELVVNGYIGELKEVRVWAPAGQGGGSKEEIPVPEGIDYDLYIGPAPMRPCSKDRLTGKASWFCSDYALGFIAGWGAHPLDCAIWGLDYDQNGPVTFKGTGGFPPATDLFNACTRWDVDIDFGGKIKMKFVSSDKREVAQGFNTKIPDNGTLFIGSEGWVSISRGSAQASNMDWLRLRQCEGNKRLITHKNYSEYFVNAVRERLPSIAPVEDAVRSDSLSHLSLLAIKEGKKVSWDPKAYKILSPAELNSKMSTEIRGNWHQS